MSDASTRAPDADRGEILVVNAGSTSLKLVLVGRSERCRPIDGIDAVDAGGVAAVAHRVVHGGPRFREPVLINDCVREQIFEQEPLAPLHNAPALEGIKAAISALPDAPQVAVFDTGFHATIPAWAAGYAVPSRWRDEWGIRRYGFHGLSVCWSAERAPELLERDGGDLRLVVCHLGGGCSVSAVRDGRSVDTTMGFTPLEGMPMATRSGSVDPGALIYLLRERGLDPERLEHQLNFDSGLRGLAGGSGRMLDVETAALGGDGDAELALEVFVRRLAGFVAAMATSVGGLDALVFTAGIGENSALIRDRVCGLLGFLGVELDPGRNRDAEPDCRLDAPGSGVAVLVVRAREELVAARAARALVGAAIGARRPIEDGERSR